MSEKRVCPIKMMTTEAIAEMIRQRAQQAGCSQSDLVHDMVCMSLFRCTYGEHVADSRRAAIAPQGAEVVQIRAGS